MSLAEALARDGITLSPADLAAAEAIAAWLIAARALIR